MEGFNQFVQTNSWIWTRVWIDGTISKVHFVASSSYTNHNWCIQQQNNSVDGNDLNSMANIKSSSSWVILFKKSWHNKFTLISQQFSHNKDLYYIVSLNRDYVNTPIVGYFGISQPPRIYLTSMGIARIQKLYYITMKVTLYGDFMCKLCITSTIYKRELSQTYIA
jgi:hypothetical protein